MQIVFLRLYDIERENTPEIAELPIPASDSGWK
jgi:hypothetical protein